MFRVIFGGPGLIVFCCFDDHGFTVTGLVMIATGVVLECCVMERDLFCCGCGAGAMSRGMAAGSLAYVLFGNRSSMLVLRVRWYRCEICGWFW